VHDYFFLGQAAIERRIEVLPDPLLFYRTHTTNTIKSGAAGSVTREAMDMALALLRELAPLLAASADARRAAALFFRGMMEDNVDFRGATFIHLMAQLASRASEGEIAALLASLNVEQFPEMAEGSSRRMKNRAARRDHRRLIATVQSTRWYALGRVFGLSPRFHYDEAADPERNLSRLKTTVNTSRWLTLGRRLGVLYLPDL
jgi:ribosomal protein L29